jgi:hypothetical protein
MQNSRCALVDGALEGSLLTSRGDGTLCDQYTKGANALNLLSLDPGPRVPGI